MSWVRKRIDRLRYRVGHEDHLPARGAAALAPRLIIAGAQLLATGAGNYDRHRLARELKSPTAGPIGGCETSEAKSYQGGLDDAQEKVNVREPGARASQLLAATVASDFTN